MDTTDGESMAFEWNIFPGFTTLQFVRKVQEFIDKIGDPAQFPGRIIFVSIFNDIIWRTIDNEQERIASVTLVFYLQKDFQQDVLESGSDTKRHSFSQRKFTRRMGQSRWIDHDHAEKADSQFSESRL